VATPSRSLVMGCLALLCGLSARAEPLDLQDPTPRPVQVDWQGQTAVAGFAVDGDSAVVSLSAEAHEQLRPHFLEPVPGSFSPLVITIDRSLGVGTSSQASGAWASGPTSASFVQGPLSTEATAGFVQSSQLPPLLCTSQQELDDACLIVSLYCGAVCVIVPGSHFDPDTGGIGLVGGEEQSGCDGAICSGPFVYFSQLDPVLSEIAAPALPSLGDAGMLVLAGGLLLAGLRNRIRPGARSDR